MIKNSLKTLLMVALLITMTCVAMAYSSAIKPQTTPNTSGNTMGNASQTLSSKAGPVNLSANLVQNKIFVGGDGKVTMSLTLAADKLPTGATTNAPHNVDMVIVLDRSGSMRGPKMSNAKQAITQLVEQLSPQDRIALVSYSVDVIQHTTLLQATRANKTSLLQAVRSIRAGGGTNLGAGLEKGMGLLTSTRNTSNMGNSGKVILISDGLANHGVTDAHTLGSMASSAVPNEYSISTVGLGNDFNEQLMTRIADQGTGQYYYLENADAFAEVFLKEFQNAKSVAASQIEIRVPLHQGLSLVNAAGYPITVQNGQAVFRPGNLLSGQSRKFFITLQVPAHLSRDITIQGLNVGFTHQGKQYVAGLPKPFIFACVDNQEEVVASIDKKEWEKKVVQEDYSVLQDEVAKHIREGNEQKAKASIKKYRKDKESLNATVKSDLVNDNLDKDLGKLEMKVEESFSAATPADAARMQKKAAKEIQHKGYKERRSLQ